jgi:hypothetical protein
VFPHKLPKLDLAKEADALAVLAPAGGETGSSCKRTDLHNSRSGNMTAVAGATTVNKGLDDW